MYQLKEIGKIVSDTEHTVISIKADYRKALKNLELFSHVHIFYADFQEPGWSLQKRIIHIQKVDRKRGIIIAESDKKRLAENILFDMKPYFPCEDSLKELIHTRGRERAIELVRNTSQNGFEVEAMGMIRQVNGESYVQLKELGLIETPYIKLFWWFHKFDSELYRKATECNPPYENAPRSGIFSTRSPVRPNPIAMTIVKVLRADYEKKRLYIEGIESFDQTPCLGYASYQSQEDCIINCTVPEWLSHWPQWIENSKDENKDEKNCEDTQEDTTEVIREDTREDIREDIREDTSKDEKLETLWKEFQKDQINPRIEKTEHREQEHWKEIVIQGARENNLRGVNVVIPYGKITVVVGVSGSGKSSLVNDTIYVECRRRMENLTNNRNLLQKPNVESIRGCIPAVIIKQDTIRGNSLSTIGTYTNAYDYLRIIYASIGTRHCPNCGGEIIPLTREKILSLLHSFDQVEIFDLTKSKINGNTLEESMDKALSMGGGAFYMKLPEKGFILLQTKQMCYRCNHLMLELTPQNFSYRNPDSRCPVCHGTGETLELDLHKIINQPQLSLLDGASSFYGKLRAFLQKPNANWIKGQVFGLAETLEEDLEKPWKDLKPEFKEMLLYGSGEKVVTFRYQNVKNGRNGEIIRPVEGITQIISRINSDHPDAKTIDRFLSQVPCSACHGERLEGEGRTTTVHQIRYPQASAMNFYELARFCDQLFKDLSIEEIRKIETPLSALYEITEAAQKLGIGYLPLNRDTGKLSGGERQRVKLLGALINHISGILYIFDEPSKGLHPKDYHKVANLLQSLKEEGNTILLVEHNEDMIRIADYLIEIGPGAGKHGGLLVGEGTLPAMLSLSRTQISKYMMQERKRTQPYMKQDLEKLSYVKMEHLISGNLKNISIEFPQNAFTCICGVSGSGKSTLMKGEIFEQAKRKRQFSEVVLVDQLSVGKTSKSIIATYTGIMDMIRFELSSTMQAVEKGMDERYFSFNGTLGQCQSCHGDGRIKVKFMEDTEVPCPDCNGKRYRKEILEIRYNEKNIDDLLNMSIEEAILFWSSREEIALKLKSLQKTGLGYLLLGQSTASLSGGEAARLRLSKELVTKTNSNVLYLLDEPTTGLHFSDIGHLLELICEMVKSGNTVMAIEHNKYFIHNCDWIIELGPGAGEDGGQVIYQGKINLEWTESYHFKGNSVIDL